MATSSDLMVAAIDYRSTRIYRLDADPDGRPTRVVAEDPKGYFRHLHSKAGTLDGFYLSDDPEYWRAIAAELREAAAVLVLGHGTGKANASHKFIAYCEEHDRELAQRIVGDLRCDIDDLTDRQVLRLAQRAFEPLT